MKRGQFNKVNPGHFDFGASLRKPCGESSFARLVRQYKANARRRSISFDLTDIEVRTITSSKCVYCGIEPKQSMHNKDSNGAYVYNGIDRVEKGVGYTRENSVAACKVCNRAKSDMPIDEWNKWLERVANLNTGGRRKGGGADYAGHDRRGLA